MIPAMIDSNYQKSFSMGLSQCGIFGNPDPPKHPNDSLYDDSRSIGIKIVRWHAASRADRGRCVSQSILLSLVLFISREAEKQSIPTAGKRR